MAKPTVTKAHSGNAQTAWQVKGVTPETRAAVRAAARRAGTTIGAWTNEALHRAATAELTGDARLPAPRIDEQLAAIERRLDGLSRPFWQRMFRLRASDRSALR